MSFGGRACLAPTKHISATALVLPRMGHPAICAYRRQKEAFVQNRGGTREPLSLCAAKRIESAYALARLVGFAPVPECHWGHARAIVDLECEYRADEIGPSAEKPHRRRCPAGSPLSENIPR